MTELYKNLPIFNIQNEEYFPCNEITVLNNLLVHTLYKSYMCFIQVRSADHFYLRF
jgi:hypothetical protein